MLSSYLFPWISSMPFVSVGRENSANIALCQRIITTASLHTAKHPTEFDYAHFRADVLSYRSRKLVKQAPDQAVGFCPTFRGWKIDLPMLLSSLDVGRLLRY